MRELTLQELELISGGSQTVPEVVIVSDGDGGDGGGDWGDNGDWGDGGVDQGGDSGDWGGGTTPTTIYPNNFDFAADKAADGLAKSLGQQIKIAPNSDKVEYSALIYKDASGNVLATRVEMGDVRSAPIDKLVSELPVGSSIMAVVHSHPVLYNAGSDQYPNWQPRVDGQYLSGGDFDQLIDHGTKDVGYDHTNYRSYLVYDDAVSEFYAFEQDASRYGAGHIAKDAVASSDYFQNTH